MTGLIVAASIVAYLGAYFYLGWRIAKWDMPSLWARARSTWSSEKSIRSMVTSGTVLTVLFWPLRFVFVAAAGTIDRHDPERIKAELAEQQRRIAELERELNITPLDTRRRWRS